MRDVADSLRELVVANNTRPLSIDRDLFDGFHLRCDTLCTSSK